MSLAATQIEKTYQSYRGVKNVRKDDSFALLYLTETFGIDQKTAEKQVAFGGSQSGVDAYHFDPQRRNFYLFITKWSKDHGSFKEPIKSLVYRGMDFIFGSSGFTTAMDQFGLKMKSVLSENRSLVDQVLIHFVFNGDPAEADQSESLAALCEELEAKKYLVDEFFGSRPVSFLFEFRSNETDAVAGLTHSVKTHTYKIDFHRSITSETPSGENLQVGFIKLVDLYEMYQEMGPRFFDRNIRSGLSGEKSTNKSIRATLESIVLSEKADPEAFIFNHNGITLSAENFEIKKGAAYITEPRLLNGAQTVTTLARFIEDYEGQHGFEQNLHILDRIRVIGKVVSSASQQFVANVTICNNRQNPVEPWNLRANDPIQLEYQEKFRRELGLYYERQEGAFAGLTESDLDELGMMESSRAIEIKKLAQTILAAQGEVDKIPRLRYVFETDSAYTNTFRDSYLRCNAKRILLAYKIQYRLNMVVREFTEKYPNKYHYLGRGRGLVWALLVQALFNDPKVAELTEAYGGSLTIENDFAELLRDIGSKRIRPILSDLMAEQRYQEMIDAAQFGFLRTKATYQRCMQFGATRFGWKKHSF